MKEVVGVAFKFQMMFNLTTNEVSTNSNNNEIAFFTFQIRKRKLGKIDDS